MPDVSISVTYGDVAFALVFRRTADGLTVRRDYQEDRWKPVATVQMSPHHKDPALTEVIINGDLKQGLPFYAWMDEDGVETLKGLKS